MVGTTVNVLHWPSVSNLVQWSSRNKNSGNFEADPFKQTSKQSNRHKNKNKNKGKQNEGKEEATVGGVIDAAPIHPTEEAPDLTENVPDNNDAEPSEDSSDESSQEEDSSHDDDAIDTDMERVYAMINSGFNKETNIFDPKVEEEKYYANRNAALIGNVIVRCVTVEPTYEDDDYGRLDFNDSNYEIHWICNISSTFYNKVITSGTNKDRQLILLLETIPCYFGTNQYPYQAESFHCMLRKLEAEFMPIASHRRDYGTIDAAGVFHWRPDALDTEEDYKQDSKIWDRNFQAGSQQPIIKLEIS